MKLGAEIETGTPYPEVLPSWRKNAIGKVKFRFRLA
jgi:hypothetical protein